MSDPRYDRLGALMAAALDLDAPERAAFVARKTADDPSLGQELLAMLAADDRSDDVFGDQKLDRASRGLSDLVDGPSTAVRPPGDPDRPEHIGDHRIVRRIGEGGMGTVYEAEQIHPRRTVALKILKQGLHSALSRQRFTREIRFLAQLEHPGIARIYAASDGGASRDAPPYFTMELVDGADLLTYADDAHLSTEDRIELFVCVCDAVQHAHQKGVIHRDLKPGNILVTPAGQPKVLDFGVARAADETDAPTLATATGQVIGTLPYMSPEQVDGSPRDVDTVSDVYALGVLLYRLLSGEHPYDLGDQSIAGAARVICTVDPAPLTVARAGTRDGSRTRTFGAIGRDLDVIARTALAKDPARRYPSARALADDLGRVLRCEPITARPPTIADQWRKFARRHPAIVTAGVAAVVLTIMGVAGTLRFAADQSRQRAAADQASYRFSIAAAGSALELGDLDAARRYLRDAPESGRDWEWRHFSLRSVDPTRRIRVEGARVVDVGTTTTGARLALAIADDGVQVVDLDAPDAPDAARRLGPPTRPLATAFTADASEVLTAFAEDDRRSRLHWLPTDARSSDAPAATPMPIRIPIPGPVTRLAVDTRARSLAVLTDEFVGIVDLPSGETRWAVPWPRRKDNTRLVTIDPTGRWLAVTNGSRLSVRDAASGQERFQGSPKPARGIMHLEFDPTGSRLLLTTGGQWAGMIQCDDGPLVVEPIGIARRVSGLRFSIDGTSILAFEDDAIRQRTFDGAITARWSRPSPGGGARGITPDGAHLWEVSRDRESADGAVRGSVVHLRPTRDRGATELRGHTHAVYCVSHDARHPRIATAGWDGTVRIWHRDTGALIRTIDLPLRDRRGRAGVHAVRLLEFMDDGQLFALGDTGQCFRVDADAGTVAHLGRGPMARIRSITVPMNDEVDWSDLPAGSSIAFQGGGVMIRRTADAVAVLRGNGTRLEFVDPHRGTITRTMPLPSAATFCFDADEGRLATGHDDGRIEVRSAADGHLIGTVSGHSGAVFALVFSPDGRRLVSGGADGQVLLWDTASWKQLGRLGTHAGYVQTLAFSPDGTVLASGSGDTTVRLWQAPSEP